MRGNWMLANGIKTQNPTNDAMQMATAHLFAPSDAGIVARNVFDPCNVLRSVTVLPLAGKAHNSDKRRAVDRDPSLALVGHEADRNAAEPGPVVPRSRCYNRLERV